MQLLTEDPTYLAGGLALLAAAFLIAMRLTQQGKFLIWAGAALGVALLSVVTDWLWVTDNERVEQAVYGLAKAVAASDVPGMLSYFDEDVHYTSRTTVSLPAKATRTLAESLVANTKFDRIRVTQIRANVGGQSRRGTADFGVEAGGKIQGAYNYDFLSVKTAWSFGLREVRPGIWKVNRITLVESPQGENILP